MNKTIGMGNEKNICIQFHENGLGDAVYSLPALWQKLQDGYSIELHGNPFMKSVYERMGITFADRKETYHSIGTMEQLQSKFGVIYAIENLCLEHEDAVFGNITMTRFEQFASQIESTVPTQFNFKSFLGSDVSVGGEKKVLFAPYSRAKSRAYPFAEEAFDELNSEFETEYIGLLGQNLSYEEFAGKISNALCVVAVDSAVLHFALAFGVPTIALLGGTDAWSVVYQYRRFGAIDNIKVLQSNKPDLQCERPCSFQPARGFGRDKKCAKPGAYSDCMSEILPDDILETTMNFLSSKEQ